MITKDDLLTKLSGTIGKSKVLELSRILKEENFALSDLIDLTFIANKEIAFRAAWILENIFLQDQLRYENDMEYLLSGIKNIKHPSCQRHYVKILMHITGAKTIDQIKNKLHQLDLEPAAEQCFDWLINPKVKIAVKVFAIETLFNLRTRYPWINDELVDQINFLMRNGSPGIRSKGKKLLSRL